MATILGDCLMWLIGNQDALVLLVSYTTGIGILFTLLMTWKSYERRRDED